MMKNVCVLLVCLSVVCGFINCSPMSPLDMFPEKVLTKQPEHESSVLDMSNAMVSKFVKLIVGSNPSINEHEALEALKEIDGIKEHLESMEHLKQDPAVSGSVKEVDGLKKRVESVEPSQDPAVGASVKEIDEVKESMEHLTHSEDSDVSVESMEKHLRDDVSATEDFSSKVPSGYVASKLLVVGDLTEGTKDEEKVILEPISDGTVAEVVSRKRRAANVPPTKIVAKPYVEARYQVENSARPADSAHFLKESNFMISDPDALYQNGRPVIIYIGKLASLNLQQCSDAGAEIID